MQRLLVDSGSLVALFDGGDRWHGTVVEFMKGFRGHLLTSAANITEAAWITGSVSQTMMSNLLTWLYRGAVVVHNIEADDLRRIATLSVQYQTLRPDFADLALLALAERTKVDRVITLDKKDFDVYRLKNGKPLRNMLTLSVRR